MKVVKANLKNEKNQDEKRHYASKLFGIQDSSFADCTDLKDILRICFKIKKDILSENMTREQVFAAYNLFLGRNPENESVINDSINTSLFRRVNGFCTSDEFYNRFGEKIYCYSLIDNQDDFIDILYESTDFPYLKENILIDKEIELPEGECISEIIFYNTNQINYPIEFLLMDKEAGIIKKFTSKRLRRLNINIPYSGIYRLICRVQNNEEAEIYARSLTIYKGADLSKPINHNIRHFPLTELHYILLGTTSTCNSSCIHCPVNKKFHNMPEPAVMDIKLFSKIIEEIASAKIPVTGRIHFGLFNEALLDPFLNERIKIIRTYLPGVPLFLNTNAALFSEKHTWAVAEVDGVGIQVSGFSKDIYEIVMHPLQRDKTFKNVENIIKLAKNVIISVPTSKLNIGEFPAIKNYWLEKGASRVSADPLSNRCGEIPNFAQLSVAPHAGICRGDIVKGLIVDFDGTVLPCCQDFLRRDSIGNLAEQSLQEILSSKKLKEFMKDLDSGLWDKHSCRFCLYDNRNHLDLIIKKMENEYND